MLSPDQPYKMLEMSAAVDNIYSLESTINFSSTRLDLLTLNFPEPTFDDKTF